MHYLLSPYGSSGDVHPMLGLGAALQQRGHRVTMIVHGYFADAVERLGLDYVELGTREEFLEAANNPLVWDPLRSFGHICRAGIIPTMRRQYDIFAEHYQPGETVGITNCLGVGGFVAQEHLGIPVISLHLQPAVIWSRYAPPHLPGLAGPNWIKSLQFRLGERFFIDPHICPELNRFRAELGLPPVRRLTQWWHSPWCVACLFPPWYCPPQPDWPPNVLQTDFPLWDDGHDEPLPADVADFLDAGDPPLVFTPGSANFFGAPFFDTAVDVCRRLGRRGMLLTRFPEQLPRSLPEGVAHFDYVPFKSLLPRAAAIVHHGGIGTLAQGLAAGIPQMIMAIAHDQFDNAQRIREFGVGDWTLPKKFRPRLVARKLDALLSSAKTQINCRELAQRLQPADGLARMAREIEERGAEPYVRPAERG